ncbi:MAG: zinc-dependent metalloprotease [Betaproteobacteria bacterium]|nr:zinc-dependent metalloprotease [Betaproteobacteria bacterium]
MSQALPGATVALALAAAGLAGCAAIAPASDSPAPKPVAATAPAKAAAPAPVPGQPRPFKEVAKDAIETAGFFAVHRKDEKAWIAIRPEQFDKPFFFTWNIPQSLGEKGLYGSQMGGSRLVVLKKIGNQAQLIAKNVEFHAKEGTPQAQFVSESFSDSLVASAPVVSLPHPESKAVLVELNALLFGDIPGYGSRIEGAFRLPYALDGRNTSIARVTQTELLTSVQVKAHFATPKIPAPPLAPSPMPAPAPPKASPDPRSFFVTFQYSFTKLPDEPMRTRVADERIGHFAVSRVDYTEDTSPKMRQHVVARWRLEKKDPKAAMSEPKAPIVYWVDRNVPEKYRQAVTEGILEWNKAFERIGFKDAIVVKQQSDKDDFDTMDARHATVRWFTGADVGFAIGPSHKDPRTGEILDADIATGSGFARQLRRLVAEDLGKTETADPLAPWIANPLEAHKPNAAGDILTCGYAWQSAREFEFALDVLEARGIGWGSPEADALAKANLRRNVMHEVGHTLGLRHNFRASGIYTLEQLADPAFTKVNGSSGSIMEYLAINVAAKGEKQGEFVGSTLGPYDYWAIEYAYRDIATENEAAELAKIASRSTEPQLAYATDEDAGYSPLYAGIDPEVNRFDLGSDPLAYYRKRIKLSRELWDRVQDLQLAPGESYERLTRSLASGMQQVAAVTPLVAKYVGGVRHLRDRAGTGRPLYEPTPSAKQREALKLVTESLFQPASFRFKPEFVSRIGIDHFERPRNPDVSIATGVLNVQKAALDALYDDGVAARLVGAGEKVAVGAKPLPLSEVYDTLREAIWSELRTGGEIPRLRRNLQREHLLRVANALVKPSATLPADARALQRESANSLQSSLRAAAAKGGLAKETRAHLKESLDTLDRALAAPLLRAGA